jgi:hypothetical protein
MSGLGLVQDLQGLLYKAGKAGKGFVSSKLQQTETNVSNYFQDVASIATASPEDLGGAVKEAGKEAGSWFRQQFSGLFAKTEATASAISQAQQEESTATTTEAKVTAKEKQGAAAKAYLKDATKSAAAHKAIDLMTPDEAVKYFNQLKAGLAEAEKKGNIGVYFATKKELVGSLKALSAMKDLAPSVVTAAEGAVKQDQISNPKVKKLMAEKKDQILASPPSKDGLAQLQTLASYSSENEQMDTEILSSAESLGMSKDVIVAAKQSIVDDKALTADLNLAINNLSTQLASSGTGTTSIDIIDTDGWQTQADASHAYSEGISGALNIMYTAESDEETQNEAASKAKKAEDAETANKDGEKVDNSNAQKVKDQSKLDDTQQYASTEQDRAQARGRLIANLTV